MSGFVESANAISADVLARLWTVLWQWTLIAVVAAAVILWLRQAQPSVRFWLWNLVLLKLALMPFWMVTVESAAPAEPAATKIQDETTAVAGVSNPDRPPDMRPDTPSTTGDVALKTSGNRDATPTRVEDAAVAWPVWLIVVWSTLVTAQ